MVNVGKYPMTMDPMGLDSHAKRENSHGAHVSIRTYHGFNIHPSNMAT